MPLKCHPSVFKFILQFGYPWLYGIPTLALNVYLCTKFLKRKEFSHVFYRLFVVYSASMCFQWFFSFFEYLYELEFTISFLRRFLTINRVFVAVPQYFNAFIDFNGLICIVLISANRLSIVVNPLNANKVWCRWLLYIFTFVLSIAAVLAIPEAFAHAHYEMENETNSVSFPNTFPLDVDIHFLMHIITFSLVTIFTVTTFVIAKWRNDISRHIKERKIVFLGGVLSAVFGVILVFEVLLSEYSPLHKFVPEETMGAISEAYEIFDDIASCSPVWILLVSDPAVRRQFRPQPKSSSTVNVTRINQNSQSQPALPLAFRLASRRTV